MSTFPLNSGCSGVPRISPEADTRPSTAILGGSDFRDIRQRQLPQPGREVHLQRIQMDLSLNADRSRPAFELAIRNMKHLVLDLEGRAQNVKRFLVVAPLLDLEFPVSLQQALFIGHPALTAQQAGNLRLEIDAEIAELPEGYPVERPCESQVGSGVSLAAQPG